MKTKGNLKTKTVKECDNCNLDFYPNVQCCPICDRDLTEVTIVENK